MWESKVVLLSRPPEGKWILVDPVADASAVNEALENFTPKELVKLGVCPTCKRVVGKINVYSPLSAHIKLIERMWRTIKTDPKQRGYCFITNNAGLLEDDERIIMAGGSSRDQYHKANYIGLIAPVGKDGKMLPREMVKKKPHRKCCFTVTKKGMDLVLGDRISPWTVYRQHSRYVMLDKSSKTSGTREDIEKGFKLEQLPPDLADLLPKRPSIIYDRREPEEA